MVQFLKGNYELPERVQRSVPEDDPPMSLTEKMEAAALAKLGGSICFVVKGKTLLWTGDPIEETG